jgi:hypothetical protein
LAVATFMAVGLQFIFLWILAEYIGRIYEESKARPVYVINNKTNVERQA